MKWLLRGALAVSFLSAVADRFGLWGAPGAPGVAWGDWAHFEAYASQLNRWAPSFMRVPLAWAATLAELVVAVALLVRPGRAWVGLASGLLLSAFAATMTLALGPKAPLDYSVWTAAAASFLVASLERSV